MFSSIFLGYLKVFSQAYGWNLLSNPENKSSGHVWRTQVMDEPPISQPGGLHEVHTWWMGRCMAWSRNTVPEGKDSYMCPRKSWDNQRFLLRTHLYQTWNHKASLLWPTIKELKERTHMWFSRQQCSTWCPQSTPSGVCGGFCKLGWGKKMSPCFY